MFVKTGTTKLNLQSGAIKLAVSKVFGWISWSSISGGVKHKEPVLQVGCQRSTLSPPLGLQDLWRRPTRLGSNRPRKTESDQLSCVSSWGPCLVGRDTLMDYVPISACMRNQPNSLQLLLSHGCVPSSGTWIWQTGSHIKMGFTTKKLVYCSILYVANFKLLQYH